MNHSAKPRVSVIIPTFNRCALLRQAIESVIAQTFTSFEIIVVDDGSTDETAEFCKSMKDRIIYLAQPNRGVAAARNTGLQAAAGEFICFLDSDDLWEPRKLEVQVAFADTYPSYALVATEIGVFNEQGLIAGRSKASMYRIVNGMAVEDLLFSNWIQTSTVLLRAETLREIGGFDEDVGQFGEDWLLWLRVASRRPIYFLPDRLVLYRAHNQSLTSEKPEAQYAALMLILQKARSLPQFRAKPYLIKAAAYRIAIGRARSDLQSGHLDLAMQKLQHACTLHRFPLRAAGLRLRANLAGFLHAFGNSR